MELSQALQSVADGEDDRALALLYEAMAPAIRRLATRLTGDAQLAEECVAETLLHARRSAATWHPRSCDPERDARRWVLGIAATTALAAARSRRRARARDARAADLGAQSAPPPPEASVIEHELVAIMRTAVARLPRIYGDAVAARFLEDLDLAAASARLGVPAATVKTRVFRGLSLLRRHLEPLRGALALLPCVPVAALQHAVGPWRGQLGRGDAATAACAKAGVIVIATAMAMAALLAPSGTAGAVRAPMVAGAVVPAVALIAPIAAPTVAPAAAVQSRAATLMLMRSSSATVGRTSTGARTASTSCSISASNLDGGSVSLSVVASVALPATR